MKTITEFFGPTILSGSQKYSEFLTLKSADAKAAILSEEGKTEADLTDETLQAKTEELAKTELGQAFKLEGEKLDWFLACFQFMKLERGRVKRALVMAPQKDGEKPQLRCHEKDGKFFHFEFFPEAQNSQARNDRFGGDASIKGHGRAGDRGAHKRGKRDDSRSGKSGDRDSGRDGFKRGEGERGARRAPKTFSENAIEAGRTSPAIIINPPKNQNSTEHQEIKRSPSDRRPARPPRRESAPRFDVAAVDAAIATEPPYLGVNRIVPKVKTVATTTATHENS